MHNFFLEIQGQKNALNLLSELHTKNRIPHALLFSGVEGCGKFHTAIQFLKLLNENNKDIISKISNLSEPFVKLIMPLPRGKSETNSDLPTSKLSQDIIDEINKQIYLKAKNNYHKIEIKNANNIKINSIREINKLVSLNFDEIAYRGMIIYQADKMTIEAQNAFLKNLEEPPEGIIYILLTNNPEKLLTTIKSRCWEINFTPLQEEEISTILRNNTDLTESEIKTIIPFAQGSITKALFLHEHDISDYLHKTILILRYSLAKKYYTAVKEFNDIISSNSIEAYEIIIDLIIAWFNDTLKQKFNPNLIDFIEYEETLEKFNHRFSETDLNKIITKLAEYRNAPSNNVGLNLLVLNVIFEIASIGMKQYDRK